jgi:Flp pilus assembly protein TadD
MALSDEMHLESSGARPTTYAQLVTDAEERERSGDVDGALDRLRRALPMSPQPAQIHNRIGVLLAMRRGEYDKAIIEIRKAVALAPENIDYRSNLGKVLRRARSERD